jgi:hypothetical protein
VVTTEDRFRVAGPQPRHVPPRGRAALGVDHLHGQHRQRGVGGEPAGDVGGEPGVRVPAVVVEE